MNFEKVRMLRWAWIAALAASLAACADEPPAWDDADDSVGPHEVFVGEKDPALAQREPPPPGGEDLRPRRPGEFRPRPPREGEDFLKDRPRDKGDRPFEKERPHRPPRGIGEEEERRGPPPHLVPPPPPHEPPIDDPEFEAILRKDRDLERETHKVSEHIRHMSREIERRTSKTDAVAKTEKGELEEIENARTRAREELARLVEKHFQVRQERRRLELSRMEARLKRLKESIENREKQKEKVVQARVAELLGDDVGF